MTEITKTEAIGKLVNLAKQVELSNNIDWTSVRLTQDQLYEVMADNVIEQMLVVPDDHRETIMMGTMIRLLVENFALNARISNENRV